MNTSATAIKGLGLGPLLRGEAETISAWISSWTLGRTIQQAVVILLGAGAFGAAAGCWRDPLQALYSSVKLPMILLLTASGNALINGMLAPLLGLNLSLRQSFSAVWTSFTLAATILGAFSPLMLFLVWNLPPLTQGSHVAPLAHATILLAVVAIIAFAGVASNIRLFQLLKKLAGSSAVAWRLLVAWLALNLLLGSQLSYNLRPFIGSPEFPVQFFRPNPLQGNFFETVVHMILKFFQTD